ncbi:MAG: lipocalin family protein [Desulfofustis sp.]|nr:lipocalin family protein [Desulfofustis sp.]
MWLLARAPRVSESVKIAFENRAGSLGFPVDKLIWLDQ